MVTGMAYTLCRPILAVKHNDLCTFVLVNRSTYIRAPHSPSYDLPERGVMFTSVSGLNDYCSDETGFELICHVIFRFHDQIGKVGCIN